MFILVFDNIKNIDDKNWRDWLNLDYNQFITHGKYLHVIKMPIKVYLNNEIESCLFGFPIDLRFRPSNIKWCWSHDTILPNHKFMYHNNLYEFAKENNYTYYKDF